MDTTRETVQDACHRTWETLTAARSALVRAAQDVVDEASLENLRALAALVKAEALAAAEFRAAARQRGEAHPT